MISLVLSVGTSVEREKMFVCCVLNTETERAEIVQKEVITHYFNPEVLNIKSADEIWPVESLHLALSATNEVPEDRGILSSECGLP